MSSFSNEHYARLATGRGKANGKAPGGINQRTWEQMVRLVREEGKTPTEAARALGMGNGAVKHLTAYLFS